MLEGCAFGHEAAALKISARIREWNEPADIGTGAGARPPDSGKEERRESEHRGQNHRAARARAPGETREQEQGHDGVEETNRSFACEPGIDHGPRRTKSHADDTGRQGGKEDAGDTRGGLHLPGPVAADPWYSNTSKPS